MSGHTPGPWRVGKHLGSRSEVRVIHYDAGERGRGIEVIEGAVSLADARLIAAAPELLEALESLLLGVLDIRGIDIEGYCLSEVGQARAAIAKATQP